MTGQIRYRISWTWQRGEEALLTVRYYWWCVQCATFVVLPMVRSQYGWYAVGYCLRHAASPAYVYDERHSWHSIRWEFEQPVDPWVVIAELREERQLRERAMFLESFKHPPVPDRIAHPTRLTPLMHDDPNPWPSVRGRATVVYPTEIWDEPETVLLFPEAWPAAIEQGVST